MLNATKYFSNTPLEIKQSTTCRMLAQREKQRCVATNLKRNLG